MSTLLNPNKLLTEVYAFSKAQVSAFLGGLVDLSIMILMVELGQFHYVTGIIAGGLIGAVVNFYINRHWTFSSGKSQQLETQLLKFGVLVIGSILLKSVGTYLLSDLLGIDYRIARLITDAIVCFGFNYVLMRFWIFNFKNN